MYLFILLLLIQVYIYGYGGEGGHTVRKMETDVEGGCEGEGGRVSNAFYMCAFCGD